MDFLDKVQSASEKAAERRTSNTQNAQMMALIAQMAAKDPVAMDLTAFSKELGKLSKTLTDVEKGKTDSFERALGRMESVLSKVGETEGIVGSIVTDLSKIVDVVKSIPGKIEVESKNDDRTDEVIAAIKGQKLDPTINVPAPVVKTAPVDLSGLKSEIASLGKTLATALKQTDSQTAPVLVDFEPVVLGLGAVQEQIRNIVFPVPEHPLPFTDGDVGVQAMVVTSTADSTKTGVVVLNPDGSNIAGGAGGGGGTQYAEDTAHVSGDTVTMAGVVQQSADSALSGDGDRSLLQVDSSGYLKVNVKAGSAAATEYVEDAATAANPQGGQTMLRRRDTLTAAEVSADGDVIAANATSKGEMYVKHTDAIPVTDNGGSLTVDGTVAVSGTVAVTDNSGSLTVDDGGSSLTVDGSVSITGSVDTELPTAAALADNTANPTVPAVGAFGMVYDGTTWDRAPGTSTDGLLVNLGANNDVTVTGTVAVTQSGTWDEVGINDSGNSITVDDGGTTLSIDDGAGSITVDGTVAATQSGSWVLAANSGVDVGDVTINNAAGASAVNVQDGGNSLTVDGTVSITANSSVNVNQIGGNAVNTGTGAAGTGTQRVVTATDSTIGTVTSVTQNADVRQSTASNLNAQVVGAVAHDAVDSGNPVKLGLKAETSLASVTLVADGDRTDAYADLDGVQYARPYSLGDIKSDAVSNTDGASTASSVFTAVASTKNCIDAIHAFRTDAGTTPIYIDFRDGTAGAVLWRVVLPPNGGAVLPKADMPYFRTSANTALAYDVSAATTTVYINVSGFQSKV